MYLIIESFSDYYSNDSNCSFYRHNTKAFSLCKQLNKLLTTMKVKFQALLLLLNLFNKPILLNNLLYYLNKQGNKTNFHRGQ